MMVRVNVRAHKPPGAELVQIIGILFEFIFIVTLLSQPSVELFLIRIKFKIFLHYQAQGVIYAVLVLPVSEHQPHQGSFFPASG